MQIAKSHFMLRGLLPLGLALVVVLSGFMFLYWSNLHQTQTEQELDRQWRRAMSAKELTAFLGTETAKLASHFYAFIITTDGSAQQQHGEQLALHLDQVYSALGTLSAGGTFLKPLADAPDGFYPIRIDPVLTPIKASYLHTVQQQLQQFEHKLEDIKLVTSQRNTLLGNREKTDTAEGQLLKQAGYAIRAYNEDVSVLLEQLQDNVELLAAQLTNDLLILETQARDIRSGYRMTTTLVVVAVTLFCSFFLTLILRYMWSSRNRLVSTIESLREAQTNLCQRNQEVLALNEGLEEQVARRTEALSISELQWRDAFNAISAPIFIHDRKGKILKANQAYLEQAGVPMAEAQGRPYWTLFPKRNMPLPGCLCTPHDVSAKSPVSATNITVAERTYRSQSFFVQDEQGNYLYGMHLLEDVTEQERIKSELQEKERYFLDVTNSIEELLILLDRDLRVLMMNRAALDCCGLSGVDYRGKKCCDVFRESEIQCNTELILRVFENAEPLSAQMQMHSGKVLTVKVYPIYDGKGEVSACSIVAEDVSVRENYISGLVRYKQILSTSKDLVAFFDTEHRFLAVNGEYARYLQVDENAIVGRHASEVIGLERYSKFLQHQKLIFSDGKPFVCRDWVTFPGTGRRLMEITITPYKDDDQRVTGVVSMSRDITEQSERDARLRLSAKVLESTSEGITITDCDGNILAVNPAFCRITGYAENEVIGANPKILKSGRHDALFYQQMWESLQRDGQWRGEIWNRRKNGEVYPELLTISAIAGDDGETTNYVAVFSDISNLKQASEKLEFLAHHNPLTGLPNRLLLHARLEHSLQYAKREGTCGAVIYIDLDNFKKINDSLGHSAGDTVLKTVAARLQVGSRKVDTVAHLSGDEFVTVLHKIKTIDDAIVRAGQILGSLQQPFIIDGYEFHVGGSLGLAVFDNSTDSIETVLKNADTAMYKAKDGGKNRYHVYSPELSEDAMEKVLLENQLRKAIERKELHLYYQPQVDIGSGRIVAAEALLRWQHPEIGMVAPDKFIPLAEDTGLIIPIGEWVLRTACEQMMQWRRQGLGMKRIAVNLSGKQIQVKDLHLQVEQVLMETGLSSGSLELEITEGFVMQHPEQSIAVLRNIRNLGVELSIDDFGTGHSSLNYLKRLPINRLKIDRSFVNDICEEHEGEAITKAVIAMGRSLNLQITAEGVETVEQREFLEIHGCQEAQGFLFSPPVAAEKMSFLLEQSNLVARRAS